LKYSPFISFNLQYVSKAILPKVMTTTTVPFNRFSSLFKYKEQLEISELVGLFVGGAHLTIEVCMRRIEVIHHQ